MVLGGATSANAADLGGNCCADLEERIAELEATTVRKGNRKVSLEVSGHVNEAILFWDAGNESNVYQGTNDVARTRVRFKGEAKIDADWKAGYLIELGLRTNRLSRTDQDIADAFVREFDVRHATWFVDSKSMGKLWVGLTSQATDGITEVNTANTTHFARNSLSKWNGGFFLVLPDGTQTNRRWRDLQSADGASGDNVAGEGDRRNEVRYDSPEFMGFKASAAWGSDDFWDVALRYSGELSGFKLAAGIGYAEYTDFSGNGPDTSLRGCAGRSSFSGDSDQDCNSLGLSASIMHIQSGLFVTGSYGVKQDDLRKGVFADQGVLSGVNDEDKHYWIQAGLEQKFIELGKTTVYGEYFKADTGSQIGDENGKVRTFNDFGTCAGDCFARNAQAEYWGVGLNQHIEKAAMDLYIGYRHHEGDVTLGDTGAPGTTVGTVSIKDLDMVLTGAQIKF